MRAVVHRPGKGMSLEQVPDPAPEAHEVIVRVARVGICGSELHYTADPARAALVEGILGHEISGEVVALGPGVTRYRLGDRIAPMPFVGCGNCRACLSGLPHRCPRGRMDVVRGYAEFTRASEQDSVALPEGVEDGLGALVEPLAVGLRGVRMAAIEPDARVLVCGAGPIGLAAAFWSRRLGADRVVVLAASPRRRSIADAMGATGFVALSDVPDPDAVILRELGGPPDVVVEAVGLPGAIDAAVGWVRMAGTVVSLGLCTTPDTFSPEKATMKEVRILFSVCSSRDEFAHAARVLAIDSRPRALITRTIPLAELPATFEALRGGGPDCKVLVAPRI